MVQWVVEKKPLNQELFNESLSSEVPRVECNLVPLCKLLSESTLFSWCVLDLIYRCEHDVELSFSGGSFGPGVDRSIIRRVLPIFITENKIGFAVGPFVSITLHGAPQTITEQRKVTMKTFGFLCLFHMHILGMGAIPVSPFLLHAAMDGRKAFAFDKLFLLELDPDRFDNKTLELLEGGLTIAKVVANQLKINALLSQHDQSVSFVCFIFRLLDC